MEDVTRPSLVRFGPFAVDLQNGEIRKHGIRLKLQRQPFDVLAALLERPGHIVTREELTKRLWPDGVFVDYERGLNKAVNRLRDILSDDADQPVHIETVPQRGYRFIGVVERTFGSIAVLPLENLADPSQEYFSDGMTDELIGELSHISSLQVTSRTSVMRYKTGPRKPIPEIARELNVDVIVEGTVTMAGDKVRITAQLIRGLDDRHIWSQRYERQLTDVLSLQADVARAIAMEIRASLKPEERNRLEQSRRVNPDAYQAYLHGSYFLHQNIRGIQKSIEWFRRAIELDSCYADAHAGLAHALIFAGIYEFCPFAEAYGEARVQAQTALELDPSNAGAHNALADVLKGLDWDLERALEEHRRARELSPSHLLTRLWHAETLSRLERHEEALAESSRAVGLDPVSAISHNNRAMLLWRARRHDEAIRETQIALELDPSHVNALWWQGLALAAKGYFPGSFACLERGLKMSGAPVFVAALGYAQGLSGDSAKATAAIEQLHALSRQRNVSLVNFATICAGIGDADSTFQWFESALEVRDGRVHQLVTPCFDRLRTDPRYPDLKARIGLLR